MKLKECKLPSISGDSISFCPECYCMTYTSKDGVCRKCDSIKKRN